MPIERGHVQGCDGNITIRHFLLKTAILHCEMAIVCSQLSTAVCLIFLRFWSLFGRRWGMILRPLGIGFRPIEALRPMESGS